MRPEYQLHKCTGMTGAQSKYWAKVVSKGVVDTKQVMEEAVEAMGTRFSAHMVEALVAGVLESMIEKTLDDGRTRRFRDYFELKLDMKGAFDEADGQFDPDKHKVKLTLRPLKRLRETVKTGTPENRKKPPRAHIDVVRSETSEEGEVKKGEDLIITGKNLKLVNLSEVVFVDIITLKGRMGTSISAERLKENTETRLVVDKREIWGYKEWSEQPAANTVMRVSVRSAGGKKGGVIRTVRYKKDLRVREQE